MDSIFSEIYKPIVVIFCDSIEKCREMSVSLVTDFLGNVSNTDNKLPYIIHIIVQRLGQPDIIEMSEEIRLSLVELIHYIIELVGTKIAVYLDDYVKILQNTIVDPYSEVRKQSCRCTSLLAKTIPAYFYQQSESLVNPLMVSMIHQHSRLRVMVIEAVGDVLQHGSSKCMDTVIPHLAQRLFDQSAPVRSAVTQVMGNWLLHLRDRYSFFHKLMPLLLTSLCDEQPEIREMAEALWHDVGMKYATENEDDLKDKVDFVLAYPTHYPPNIERPNIGCRHLMFRNLSKILPGLVRDLRDWVPATRVKSSSLLPSLLLNSEEYMTQHLELVLSALYKACGDEEKQVVNNARQASELVGYFVEPDIWTSLVLKHVEVSQSCASLLVLAAIISGSHRQSLQPHLRQIADTLINPGVLHSVQFEIQQQLLLCVCELCSVCEFDINNVGQQMFTIVMTTAALREHVFIPLTDEVLDKLHKAEGLASKQELFRKHTECLLMSFSESYEGWSSYSVDRVTFDTLLVYAGSVIGELLDVIVPIFIANLQPAKDVTVRLKFFALLSRLLLSKNETLDSCDRFSQFSVAVVRDMVIPNCLWKAGRTAAAVRTTAVSCLWTLLQSGILTKLQLCDIIEELITLLISCLQDDNKSTRLLSCRVMTRVFDIIGTSIDHDRLHIIYPKLIKRLDDNNHEIRLTVTHTFLAYLTCFGDDYDALFYEAHLKEIFQGLLIHLDDADMSIQDSVLGILKVAGKLHPSLLLKEVDFVKHKHRSLRYCDSLLEAVHALCTQR